MPSNSPVNDAEQVNGALPRASVQPVQYIGTVHDNDYVYRPEDHVFDRHRGETPVLTNDFAVAGGQQKQASSADGPLNVDTPANKTNGYGVFQHDVYEHPSAKPRPLRRVSGYSSSRSSGRSLRDLYHDAGGLGIELSENSNIYAHDNGTTLGIDGESNFERRRDMVNMESPDFYVKQSGFASTSSQRRVPKEHEYHSHPVESTKYMVDAVHSRHQKEMQNTIDLLDGKIERLISVESRNEVLFTRTRDSIDQVLAEQRRIREIMDAMLFENRKLRETMDTIAANDQVIRDTLEIIMADTHDFAAEARLHHKNLIADYRLLHEESRQIRASITDLAEHGIDNEKLDLLVDKVVERLHPTIVWAMEKGDHNTERILAGLNQGKEHKQRKSHDHDAGQTSANGYSSPTNGVHYALSRDLHFSPSAVGPFAADNNDYFSSPAHHFRDRNGDYKYSEDPSQR